MKRIHVVLSVGPALGFAAIYLDGNLVRTVDCYRATASATHIVYVDTVTSVDHPLNVTATGSKNALSSGTDVFWNDTLVEELAAGAQVAALNKFNSFIEAVFEKKHDMGADTFIVVLLAAANPPVATNTKLSDFTTINHANCSSRTLTVTGSAQTSGTWKWTVADLVLTASGGAVAAWRYGVVINDTSTDDLAVGWYDRGADAAIPDGQTFTFDFDGSAGALTCTPV